MTSSERILQSVRQAQRFVSLERPAAMNLAIDLGLRKGQRSYTRFILLGRSRTGSNFLRGLLNSHPGVAVLGEVFRQVERPEWGTDGYPSSGRALAAYRNDPAGFLDRYVFRRMPLQVQALGFKIFYYHAQSDPQRRVWERLRQDRALHVVHIKRRNLLRTHLSRARAARSDRWVQLSQDGEADAPIELSFEECRQDFQRTRLWEAEFERFFAEHALHALDYEALSEDPRREAGRVLQFLGVDVRDLAPQTYKQAREPLSLAISNYADLKLRFRDTEWAGFFDE